MSIASVGSTAAPPPAAQVQAQPRPVTQDDDKNQSNPEPTGRAPTAAGVGKVLDISA